MIRSSMFVGALLAVSLTAACDQASDAQARADKAQAEAQARTDQARAEADAKMKAAQAEAERKIAQAQADFLKEREEYRSAATVKLAELDKKIADIEARARTATGKTKAELEATLQRIRDAHDRFDANFKAIESTSAAMWNDIKATLDKELSDIEALTNNNT
jgi:hypothetical protein